MRPPLAHPSDWRHPEGMGSLLSHQQVATRDLLLSLSPIMRDWPRTVKAASSRRMTERAASIRRMRESLAAISEGLTNLDVPAALDPVPYDSLDLDPARTPAIEEQVRNATEAAEALSDFLASLWNLLRRLDAAKLRSADPVSAEAWISGVVPGFARLSSLSEGMKAYAQSLKVAAAYRALSLDPIVCDCSPEDHVPNERTVAALLESERERQSGSLTSYSSIEEMFADLNANP